MDTNDTQTLDTKLSAIDKALSAAKARKASREGSPVMVDKQDDATKAAARAAKLAEREAKKQAAAVAREARRAAKAATPKGPAHMKKLDRAASRLPELNNEMRLTFNEVTSNFSAEQITALALHLQHFNRVKATERALGQRVTSGQEVRIISGDPKYVGLTGTVSKAQRIRCYVTIPGFKRDAYCFTSDVEIVAQAAKTGTHG